jgi:hypothetical protein
VRKQEPGAVKKATTAKQTCEARELGGTTGRCGAKGDAQLGLTAAEGGPPASGCMCGVRRCAPSSRC